MASDLPMSEKRSDNNIDNFRVIQNRNGHLTLELVTNHPRPPRPMMPNAMEKRMRKARKVYSGFIHLPCFLVLLLMVQWLPAFADDRPWIGLDIVDCWVDKHSISVAVLRVEDGSPAQRVGILAGDIVVSMDGLALSGTNDFICRVIPLSPGQNIQLTLLRDGAQISSIVTLAMWPLNIHKASHSCPVQVSFVATLGQLQ
jgi:membrane-associated protease RseP (regulator of RpoE activity)